MAEPLIIPFLQHANEKQMIEHLSEMLDELERNPIGYAPWANGAATPEAGFTIAHNTGAILLKYYVQEREIRAVYHQLNDPVYEDSCVEFFIAFNDEPEYYNLEFNCAGTARVQFGPGKQERAFIPGHLLESIRYHISIQNRSDAGICWELTLLIPKEIFKYHPNLQLEQTAARVNFYKCGDSLPQPHFLCWSNIIADRPEFHLPAFFKDATFNSKAQLTENNSAGSLSPALTNKN
jgi:hypothetical protein